MSVLDEYRKAICGALVAGAGAAATAAADGHITLAEGCLVAVAFFGALGGVATVSNTVSAKHRRSRADKLEEHARATYDPDCNVHWRSEGNVLPVRPAKKLGRRPAKNARALRFADHVAAVPDHPITDLAPNLSWPMDHNDTVGCCVVAGLDHFRQVVYTSLGAAYAPWTDAELLKLYQTQNPHFTSWSQGGSAADGGMDIQTLLEYLVKQGVILGFAKVDHTNLDEMRAAIYLGLGVVTGEVLTSKNMSEQVWDYHKGDYQEGGHCTVSVGYKPGEQEVSWGALYGLTDAFVQHNVEEAWFVITQAHVDHPAFRAGFDLASFAAAYQAMTGATFPVPVTPTPVPTPGPSPTPAPVPVPDGSIVLTPPADVLAKVTARAAKKGETVEAYVEHALEQYLK